MSVLNRHCKGIFNVNLTRLIYPLTFYFLPIFFIFLFTLPLFSFSSHSHTFLFESYSFSLLSSKTLTFVCRSCVKSLSWCRCGLHVGLITKKGDLERRQIPRISLFSIFLLVAHSNHGDDDAGEYDPSPSPNLHSKPFILVKIGDLLLIFFDTFIAEISPYFFKWNDGFLVLGTQFTGGVFFSTGFFMTMAADCVIRMCMTNNILNFEGEEAPVDDLMELVQEIFAFHMKHNAEPEAVDLLMEVEDLDLLVEHVDSTNFKRICIYLTSSANDLDADNSG
ncbi:uncharacterized protein LOC120080988 [Benincasa hispida]|uniref:uncharacterized protein LOC120080988 n=1 Tax=Benincasa hispida TaxID=102211 RepID=UPI001900193E|nr:uncharacterized protein LOC120080988 [Benincasa hispida]